MLGGGGVTGIAWEIGLIAGLADAGVQLTHADLVVGTSAGSVVGVQILSGAPLEDLYAEQLADASSEIGARMSLAALARFVLAGVWPRDETRARAALGRAAQRAKTVPESERKRVIESRLKLRAWPQQRLLIVAVDAESGAPRVFDSSSGISLVDAVASSCAVPLVWPPMTVDGHRYMDGGVRSIANADLAAGCERVVVLAPVTAAVRRSSRISTQLAGLEADVRSIVVSPDAAARRAIGRNVLDPSRRAAAARAGRRQAELAASAVKSVWLQPDHDPKVSAPGNRSHPAEP